MKLVQVAGARPQFIKYLPVSNAVRRHNGRPEAVPLENVLIHTGQHYDYSMSQVFFNELGIEEPKYHLGVGSASHGAQTGQILIKVEEVLEKERPDAVVVYGDTNSTIGAALAAAKLGIPVAHVEAGLRSRNKEMPEEINRVLTDHVSTVLFCPSRAAVENLRGEGFGNIVLNGDLIGGDPGRAVAAHYGESGTRHKAAISHPVVCNVGDVMYDVLNIASGIASQKSGILLRLGLSSGGYSVLTIHRAENTDTEGKLEEIAAFVNQTANGATVVFPVHPRTRKHLEGLSPKRLFAENVLLVPPLGYFDMLWLLKNSRLVLTDSGGVQKEACWLKVPCITLREETEWVETLQSGWNVLYKEYAPGQGLPPKNGPLERPALTSYGDGDAAGRIVGALVEIFGKESSRA